MSKCDFDKIWNKAVELGIVSEETRRKGEENREFREGYVTGLLLRAIAVTGTKEGKKEDLPGK